MSVYDDFLTDDLREIAEKVGATVKEYLEDPEGTDFSSPYEFEDGEIIDADISIIYPATGRKTEVVKRFKVNVIITVMEE